MIPTSAARTGRPGDSDSARLALPQSGALGLAPVAAARYRSGPVLAPRHDPDRVLAAVAERGLALELGTLDLCFVVALYVRGQGAQLPSFTEPQLEDVFVQ